MPVLSKCYLDCGGVDYWVCKWGDVEPVRVKIAAELSHSGRTYWKDVGIDRCIAPIVRALQNGGIDMLGSCCGHGEYEGSIMLADGRVLGIDTHRVTAWCPKPVLWEAGGGPGVPCVYGYGYWTEHDLLCVRPTANLCLARQWMSPLSRSKLLAYLKFRIKKWIT